MGPFEFVFNSDRTKWDFLYQRSFFRSKDARQQLCIPASICRIDKEINRGFLKTFRGWRYDSRLHQARQPRIFPYLNCFPTSHSPTCPSPQLAVRQPYFVIGLGVVRACFCTALIIIHFTFVLDPKMFLVGPRLYVLFFADREFEPSLRII